MNLNGEQAGHETDIAAQYEDYVGREAQAYYESQHAAAEAQVAEYERRTAWIPEAAKKAIPIRHGLTEQDRRAHVAGYELALFQHEDVFLALAAFVMDDSNRAWHPSYRPIIEAGRKALEKSGWKP